MRSWTRLCWNRRFGSVEEQCTKSWEVWILVLLLLMKLGAIQKICCWWSDGTCVCKVPTLFMLRKEVVQSSFCGGSERLLWKLVCWILEVLKPYFLTWLKASIETTNFQNSKIRHFSDSNSNPGTWVWSGWLSPYKNRHQETRIVEIYIWPHVYDTCRIKTAKSCSRDLLNMFVLWQWKMLARKDIDRRR